MQSRNRTISAFGTFPPSPPSFAMASCLSRPQKNNILAVPFPLHGHITPMLQLATMLAASGFCITFIDIQRKNSNVDRFLSHNPSTLNVHVVSLPNNSPPGHTFFEFLQSLQHPFENLVEMQLNSSSPPLCILSDVHVGWTQDVATKFQLPRIALWTSNASECQVYFQAPRLISQGYLPFKGTSERIAVPVPGLVPLQPREFPSTSIAIPVPGLPPLQPREFPSFLQIEDSANILFSFLIDQTKRIAEADILLINSFHELENSVFDALKDELSKVYPVGPLFMLEGRVGNTPSDTSPDEERCLRWLDNQAADSVLYVAFGSTAPLSCARIASLAFGLEKSEQPFLWALRLGIDHLPEGFVDRTRDRGLVVCWAPQVHVLRHPSVGGFLTHCGWNSTMESLSAGVPMICSPIGADQTLTCKMLADEWMVGLKFSEGDGGFAKEEELARLAREILCEEKGRDLKKRAGELRDAARRACEGGGSSWESLDVLVEELKRWQNSSFSVISE